MKYSAAILIFCALCASCSSTPGKSTRAAKQVPAHLSKQELEEIRRYAEQFQFDEDPDGVIMYPEKPSLLVRQAIERAGQVNEERHLPYAALFVLRIYHESMKRQPEDYPKLGASNVTQEEGNYALEYEFSRIAMPPKSQRDYYSTQRGYDWIRKHKSQFSKYPPISEELDKIEQLRKRLERQRQEGAAELGLNELERFAIETPIIPHGFAPAPLPEEINRILEKLREENRKEHLPYLLEYGLNLYLKHLTRSGLARVLPVEENLMLSELIRLTKIPKYKTAHEAGWLNSQFDNRFEESNQAIGYSSYQIYIWYLENWSSLLDMPNIERLCDIQKRIEKTGIHGVGGGNVCHYGCHSLVIDD